MRRIFSTAHARESEGVNQHLANSMLGVTFVGELSEGMLTVDFSDAIFSLLDARRDLAVRHLLSTQPGHITFDADSCVVHKDEHRADLDGDEHPLPSVIASDRIRITIEALQALLGMDSAGAKVAA